MKEVIEIDICPVEPRASIISDLSDKAKEDLADCCKSGDCEDACRYVNNNYDVTFTIWDSAAKKDRAATEAEKVEVCNKIYFESETNFTEDDMANIYLIWEVASYEE